MDFYKNLLYSTILIFAFQYSYGFKETGEKELDSLRTAIRQAKTDQQKATALLRLCPYFQKANIENLDSISYYAHKALKITENSKGLEKTKVEALYYLAYKALKQKEPDSVKIFIADIMGISQKLDYGLGLTYANYRLASLKREEDKPDTHVYHLEEAYKIAKKYNVRNDFLFDVGVDLASAYLSYGYNVNKTSKVLTELEAYTDLPEVSLESKGLLYLNKGVLYYDTGDYEKSIFNYNMSYEFFKQNGDRDLMYAPLLNIALIQHQRGDYLEAIETNNKVLELGKEDTYSQAYLFIGHSNMKLGNYKKAEENLEKALSGFDTVEDPLLEGRCLRYMAELYRKTNRPGKSKQFLNVAVGKLQKHIEELEKDDNKIPLSRAYYSQFLAYQRLKDYKNALKYFKLYSRINTKINSEQQLKITERFDFFKKTLEKDNKIEVLETQNRIQQIETSKERYIKLGLLVFSVLLLLLLGIVFNRFSLKKRALKIIREKNKENELLMREIHHRVKNNLQIILSLLSGQIDKLEPDQELKSVLVESQNKIKSMAIINQNLYKENQYAQVSVSSYITELVDNIKKSFDKDKNRVHFDFNVVKEHIQMSLAVPLGLIVNELVTNSYKYAFTKGNNEVNRIKIEFEKIEDTSKYRLIIKDNGIGLPVGIDINNLKSYGLELVQGLVSQLNVTMEIIRQEGTSYHIMLEEPRV